MMVGDPQGAPDGSFAKGGQTTHFSLYPPRGPFHLDSGARRIGSPKSMNSAAKAVWRYTHTRSAIDGRYFWPGKSRVYTL